MMLPAPSTSNRRPRRWRVCRITTLISPLLVLLTIWLAFAFIMGENHVPSPVPDHDAEQSHFIYTTVPNVFAQSLPNTDAATFNFTTSNFGLIPQIYDTDPTLPGNGKGLSDWRRFERKLDMLNADSPSEVSYRLLFLGRHGQGYHNVAEAYYGTELWNCYYAGLDGSPDGSMSWSDAHLTQTGIRQAMDVNAFWGRQTAEQRMSTPRSYYVSPLDRCLQTAEVTFRGLGLRGDRPYRPVVKELLREGMGIHTCDRRSTKSYIEKHYPDYAIEDGFSEEDELWPADVREPPDAHAARLEKLLDDVFEHDSSTWISMTTHSGTIAAILRVVGHRDFRLQTGGVIPVLVKVEKVAEKRPEKKIGPWEPKPECETSEPIGDGREGRKESLEVFAETFEYN